LDRFDDLDERVIDLLARWAIPLLRVSLGIVFLETDEPVRVVIPRRLCPTAQADAAE
jgi:hypothetical protein